MANRLKDIEHLLRLAALFLFGLLVFLVARAALVPEDFGELGHFRSGSLRDNRDRAVVLAGRDVCLDCHSGAAAAASGGGHDAVGCESCHGALAMHADDPSAVTPALPDPAQLCAVCHEGNIAMPEHFPQVDVDEHAAGLDCTDCHEPHQPGLGI